MFFFNKIKIPNLMLKLLYLMVTVGIIMGIIFPYIISRFVVIEINSIFRFACIVAGFIVGLINYLTIKKNLEISLHPIISTAQEISEGKFNGKLENYLISNDIFSQLSKSIITMSESLEKMQNELKKQANIDCLTGLPNRYYFHDQLIKAIHPSPSNKDLLAVFFLDLDGFKSVNDSLGHAMGDELLKSVASRLKTCIRENDILARLGGDEFILLIPNIKQLEIIENIAERIIQEFNKKFIISHHKLNITISIGIAISPFDGTDIETIIMNADAAMYNAKTKGKSNYQFYKNTFNKEMVL